jgi:alpha-glucosidase (family GH31 glycosyl hydrolase)
MHQMWVLLICSAALFPMFGQQPLLGSIGGTVESPEGKYDPVADPAAQVHIGHARFTVLTPQMIRMEWAADARFEDRASFVFLNRHLPVPMFTQSVHRTRTGQELHLHTAALDLTYLATGDGHFTENNLSVTFRLNGNPMRWVPGTPATGNLLGTTRTLDGARGGKTREPMGRGMISRDGWVVVDDSARPLFDSADFSFPQGEKSHLPWAVERPAIPGQMSFTPGPGPKTITASQPTNPLTASQESTIDPGEGQGRQDWYFFGYGHDYKLALGDFTRVAGRIPLPPRFAFGAWWSRYWAYTDQELSDLVDQARSNNVPLDVLVIDMDWHLPFLNDWSVKDPSGNVARWTGYTWNNLLFPDPQLFLDKIHREGLKVTLNLHPASGVQPFESAYPNMARAMGIDPATKQYVPFDPTDEKFVRNYFDILHHPLEKEGVDFWWLDLQQKQRTRLAGVNATWWLNYLHFTDLQREGRRPLIFHRWGGLGNHRYEIGFSGDTVSVWESLAFQPWFTATAANVGYAYWSHDIGGHMPGVIAPELYTRWLQFGALSPILRTHTTKNADAERRIWAYPEPYSDVMKEAYHLRYALLPYIYTEARRTYDTGVAFLRPLYYDWPEQSDAYNNKGEYQYGENMVVAPIVGPVDSETGLAQQTVWIPPGDWMEWPTGRTLHGPAGFKRTFSLSQIPMYVRAGAIIPMAPPMLWSRERPLSPLIVNVFPLQQGQSSSYKLYEDAGDTQAYTAGQEAWTSLTSVRSDDDTEIKIPPVEGGYPGMAHTRSYEIRLPADWPPSSVTVNGEFLPYEPNPAKKGWRFEGNTLTTVISTDSFAVDTAVTVSIRREHSLVVQHRMLEGFSGTMQRLRDAYDALNRIAPVGVPPDELINAMQTGDRLEYRPQDAATIMQHYRDDLPKAIAAVERVKEISPKHRIDLLRAAMKANRSWTPEAEANELEGIRLRISAAYEAVEDIVKGNIGEDLDSSSRTAIRPQ